MNSGELAALLAEDRWIRRLAARLVGDAGTADDLVQDAWAAALAGSERTAPAPRAPRAWMAGIVRNLWRDRARAGARRTRREREAARVEALPSSADLAAEIELRKRVTEAVLALEEPLRRTLALRYFQDRSLQSIAVAEGVAVSTVHERERRALERLRRALDAGYGDGRDARGAWVATMVTLAHGPSGGAAAAGAMEVLAIMGATKLAVAAVVVVGAGAAWWWGRAPERAPREPARVDGIAAASDARGREGRAVDPSGAREALSAPMASPVAHEPATRVAVTGRVLDAGGRGLGGIALAWRGDHAADAPALSAADGAFALEVAADADADRRVVTCIDPDLVTLVPGASWQGWTVVVAPAASFGGIVVDGAGAPLEGARVEFRLLEPVFRAAGLHARAPAEEAWRTETDGRGRFLLERIAGRPAGALLVSAAGFRDRGVPLPESSDLALEVVLERPQHVMELVGLVLDPRGAPVPGASVSAGQDVAVTDERGAFALPWTGGTGRVARDESGTWREEDAGAVVALKAGLGPARVDLAGRDLAQPLVLQLGPAPRSVAGSVRDQAHAPLPGIVVWVADPTPFGAEWRRMDDGSSWRDDSYVEQRLDCGDTPAAVTDADGGFAIGCLLEREYSLLAFDPRTARRAGPWVVAAGAEGLELVLAAEPTARVAGRIVTARGIPRVGMRVEPRRSGGWEHGGEPPQLQGAEFGTETDADGRFEFTELATEGTTLFYAGGYTFGEAALADFADPAAIEIVEPELCELQVELADPAFADRVGALDAAGEPLETCEVTGSAGRMMVGMGTSADLLDGRSRLLLVKETARTVMLSKDGVEVLRIPVELVPGERTVLRR